MRDAVVAMANENDPVDQAALFSELLNSLTPENAIDAILALRDSNGKNRDQMRLMLNAWGKIDGANAIEALGELGDLMDRQGKKSKKDKAQGYGAYHLIAGWATTYSAAAAAFVENLESADVRAGLNQAIVDGLLVESVDRALNFVTNLPPEDPHRRRYLSSITKEALEHGSDQAMAWAGQLPEELRQGAYASIMTNLATEEPEVALAMLDDLPKNAQKGVVSRALDQWTQRDPKAASEYLAQMADSPMKDQAVGTFAAELAREDPQAAAAWATTIGNEKMRSKTLAQVTRSWLQQDQTAAEHWMQANQVPIDLTQGRTKRDGKPAKVKRKKDK